MSRYFETIPISSISNILMFPDITYYVMIVSSVYILVQVRRHALVDPVAEAMNISMQSHMQNGELTFSNMTGATTTELMPEKHTLPCVMP